MKSIHIKGLAVVFAGLAAVSTAHAQRATRTSSAPSGAAGSTTNVNVVNTPTVNVGYTPTVNVGIMPTVTVGNAVTVKEDRQPLHFFGLIQIVDGYGYALAPSYFVPAGQRAVVESFSVRCNLSQASQVIAELWTSNVEMVGTIPATSVYWPADGANRYRAAGMAPLQVVQDSGWLRVHVDRNITTGQSDCYFSAHGYLTPLQ